MALPGVEHLSLFPLSRSLLSPHNSSQMRENKQAAPVRIQRATCIYAGVNEGGKEVFNVCLSFLLRGVKCAYCNTHINKRDMLFEIKDTMHV